ncbi:MAG TPA: MarR family winged helix-turn-helix transcriptional regulator [Acidobacteriaceae bacterium]|nr:MarR family winged helix-turn-helix transcriptional regulator [Acidobacteriaceae bacterium]
MHATSIPALECLCASFRRASRALTQHYEEALRPFGLRATQFTVLQALSIAKDIRQGRLGQILAMDSTTLTRTLEIMSRRGWIAKVPGKDRRERRLRMTRAGEDLYRRAQPRWEKVQTRLRRRLGSEQWDRLLQFTNDVTASVTK